MKKIITALLFTWPLVTIAQNNKFVIDGKITADTLVTSKVYMSYEDNAKNMRDSSAIVNNTYHFTRVMKDGGTQVNLFLKDSLMSPRFRGFAQFDVQPSHVYITHNNNFSPASIKGSLLQQQANWLDVQEKKRV